MTLPAFAVAPASDSLPVTTDPLPASIGPLVASSSHRALGCDALKDEDNAGWVLRFEPAVRDAWVERIRWIRLADRLAENQQLDPVARRFDRFVDEWRCLEARAELPAWAAGSLRPIAAAYLAALGDYHGSAALPCPPETLAEHDRMLLRLSGPIFQLVPFLDEKHREAAARFGALDQLVNNLRDVAEDAAHGLCWFPADVLRRFDLPPGDLVWEGSRDRVAALIGYWLDEQLPSLRARAAEFIGAAGLHPSVETMRRETLARHARVESVLREVGLDPLRFPDRYWARVRSELQEASYPAAA